MGVILQGTLHRLPGFTTFTSDDAQTGLGSVRRLELSVPSSMLLPHSMASIWTDRLAGRWLVPCQAPVSAGSLPSGILNPAGRVSLGRSHGLVVPGTDRVSRVHWLALTC